MFFVGFMPQSALVWLREKLSQRSGPWKVLPLHEPAPLTELEGIDLYDRTRLAEEGVNNVEALAHADIVEPHEQHAHLRRRARRLDRPGDPVPPCRRRRAAHCRRQGAAGWRRSRRRRLRSCADNLSHLRTYGIRTATDLLQAYDQAIRRGGGDHDAEEAEVAALSAPRSSSRAGRQTQRSTRSRRSLTRSRRGVVHAGPQLAQPGVRRR